MKISEEIFYDKKLSDTLRDIVVNSACDLEQALRLIKFSKNHSRDVELIKKMKNCGFSEDKTSMFIKCINN